MHEQFSKQADSNFNGKAIHFRKRHPMTFPNILGGAGSAEADNQYTIGFHKLHYSVDFGGSDCCNRSQLLLLHAFRTWWDLGAQFAGFWALFKRPWRPCWCIFIALGTVPGPLFDFLGKGSKKVQKKEGRREPKWMRVPRNFKLFQKMQKCVSIAQARAD